MYEDYNSDYVFILFTLKNKVKLCFWVFKMFKLKKANSDTSTLRNACTYYSVFKDLNILLGQLLYVIDSSIRVHKGTQKTMDDYSYLVLV